MASHGWPKSSLYLTCVIAAMISIGKQPAKAESQPKKAATQPAKADEPPLVFVTSFGAGDAGAIEAFQLDPRAGALKLAYRNQGVEHPFFLALSRDKRFLYSIHAKQF